MRNWMLINGSVAGLVSCLAVGCGDKPSAESAPPPPPAPPVQSSDLGGLKGKSASGAPPPAVPAPTAPAVPVALGDAPPSEQQVAAIVDPSNVGMFGKDGAVAAPKNAVEFLNRAILVYGERRHETDDGEGPKWPVFTSLDQLVQYKILRALPTPPPGKKFVLDPKTRQVSLQD